MRISFTVPRLSGNVAFEAEDVVLAEEGEDVVGGALADHRVEDEEGFEDDLGGLGLVIWLECAGGETHVAVRLSQPPSQCPADIRN